MAGGPNLYGYAGGDPINLSDPFGLCPETGDEFPCVDIEGLDVIVDRCDIRIEDCTGSGVAWGLQRGKGGGPGPGGRPGAGVGRGRRAGPGPSLGPGPQTGLPGDIVLECAADHYSLSGIAMRAPSFIGATPIPKRALGVPTLLGASPFTNPIGILGRRMFPNATVSGRILGTRSLAGIFGRANSLLAAGIFSYDLTTIAMCTSRGGP